MALTKEDKAWKILVHAVAHCRWGTEPDNTIREAEPSDLEAAQIIQALIDESNKERHSKL